MDVAADVTTHQYYIHAFSVVVPTQRWWNEANAVLFEQWDVPSEGRFGSHLLDTRTGGSGGTDSCPLRLTRSVLGFMTFLSMPCRAST